MRIALTTLLLTTTVAAANAAPIRLECKDDVLGNTDVLYLDTEARTLRIESDLFGIKDTTRATVLSVSKEKVVASSKRNTVLGRHEIYRQSGVYKLHTESGDLINDRSFSCHTGKSLF